MTHHVDRGNSRNWKFRNGDLKGVLWGRLLLCDQGLFQWKSLTISAVILGAADGQWFEKTGGEMEIKWGDESKEEGWKENERAMVRGETGRCGWTTASRCNTRRKIMREALGMKRKGWNGSGGRRRKGIRMSCRMREESYKYVKRWSKGGGEELQEKGRVKGGWGEHRRKE